MDRELAQLQMITLGSVIVLVALSACLLALIWVTINLSQLIERCRVTLRRTSDERREPAPTVPPLSLNPQPLKSGYQPLQEVITLSEFVVDAGLGPTVPAGTLIVLRELHSTSLGLRWSAQWGQIRIPYIPSCLFRPVEVADHLPPITALDYSSAE